MNLIALPAPTDHCLSMIHDGHAAVADPGDAVPTLAALDTRLLELAAILVTPLRADHAVSAAALRSKHDGPARRSDARWRWNSASR